MQIILRGGNDMSKFIPIDIPRNKCYGNNYYETYSIRLKRNVRLYSELEYKNFLTVEMNPKVIEYCEQPLKIEIEIDGILESSIFDMWVHYRDGTEEMQEVKYMSDIDPINEYTKRARRQVQKQEQWCRANNYKYSIISEKEIEKGTYYINNLRYLYGLIKRIDIPLYRHYTKMLQEKMIFNRIKVNDILNDNIIKKELIFPTIALGIYEGKIQADINNRVINYETEIWLNNTY